VFTIDQLRLDLIPQAGCLQCFLRPFSVWRMLGISDSNSRNLWISKAFQGHPRGIQVTAPEDDPSIRVGLRLRSGQTGSDQLLGVHDVGREEQIVGRSLPDLAEEVARRAIKNIDLCAR